MFDAGKLPQFWMLMKDNYPNLLDKAVKFLLPFVIMYLCKTEFSDDVMKTKNQLWLTV
jgi:hypothetical protein